MSEYYDRRGRAIDMETWARMREAPDRMANLMVAKTEVKLPSGSATVSTVWLGLDHRFGDDGPPLIFETMIFGAVRDEYCERYATEEAALAGHDQAIAWLRDQHRCETG